MSIDLRQLTSEALKALEETSQYRVYLKTLETGDENDRRRTWSEVRQTAEYLRYIRLAR